MPTSRKKTEEKQENTKQTVSKHEESVETPTKKVEEPISVDEPKEETSVPLETQSSASSETVHEVPETRWPSSQVVDTQPSVPQNQDVSVSETNTSQEVKTESSGETLQGEGTRPIVITEDKKNNLWIFIILIILGLGVGSALFFFRGAIGKFTSQALQSVGIKKAVVSPTAPAKKEPTPTPTSVPDKVDLSKYAIKVLNGSGIKGEAAKLKDGLESEGFTVSSVGNADSSDYEKTIIKAKKDVESAFIDKLKSTLESSYSVSSTQELAEDEKDEVIVIIGSEKAE